MDPVWICQWRAEGDPLEGTPDGPLCGAPATHISCVPASGAFTCAEHKCRCAKPIPPPLTDDEIMKLFAGRHLDSWQSSFDYQQPDGEYNTWLQRRMIATIIELRGKLRRKDVLRT